MFWCRARLVVQEAEALPSAGLASAFPFPSVYGVSVFAGANSSLEQLALAGPVPALTGLCEVSHFLQEVRNQIFEDRHCRTFSF
jgi:hypothetical protein